MQKIFFLFFLIWSCSVPKCEPQRPETIQTIYGSNDGDVSYDHEVLVRGITKKCDSATVMTIVRKYVQAQSQNVPIHSVQIFQSKEHFDIAETLSQPRSYYADCVVWVFLNRQTAEPKEFRFYDNNGDVSYEGTRWKPN
jgi:hypothetical protein